MAPIPKRRGGIRPISTLDNSVSPTWLEVEDADGVARRISSATVGGGGFPDAPSSFGVPTADDEEWDGAATLAARGWLVETAPVAPNVLRLNTTFNPSRLALFAGNPPGGDIVSIYRPLTVPTVGDIALTWDAAGVFDLDFKNIEIGFRTSALATSAAEVVRLCHETNTVIFRRKYSDLSAAFVNQATTTFGLAAGAGTTEARRLFLHLQRTGGGSGWEAFYSIDAITWCRIGASTADAFTTAFLMFRMGSFNQNVARYLLANNWIRLNRFFL